VSADPDDLDALTPPPPSEVQLAGRAWPLATLTLARYAAARRFGKRFSSVLVADDIMAAMDDGRGALIADFAAATGIPPDALAEADAAEVVRAFYALTWELSAFTAGPLSAALIAGGTPTRAQTAAPAGQMSPPGSSGAGTA
jgi:hypothetical protein